MKEMENSSNSGEPYIKIDRVRHFLQFETPSLINYIEEITFYNKLDEVSSLIYDLNEFRPNLQIFDSDGTPLIFYGNKDKNNEYEIIIDFPKTNLIENDEHRTIKLKYLKHVQETKLKSTLITIFLYEGASNCVSLKECEDYEFNIQCWITDKNDQQLEDNNLLTYTGLKNFESFSKSQENDDCIMHIRIKHEIPKSLSNWYDVGLFFGLSLVLANYPLYHYNPEGIRYFVIISATVISFLTIIKGWLFQKEMDKRVRLYDKLFLVLALLLFAEVFLMIMHFTFIFIHN